VEFEAPKSYILSSKPKLIKLDLEAVVDCPCKDRNNEAALESNDNTKRDATDPVIVFARDKAIFTKDHPLYAVLIESKESEDYDDHFEEFEFAAKHFGEKIKFVYLNTDVEKYWETIEFLGLIAEDVPTVMFIDVSKGLEKFKAEFDEVIIF
ncbi:unnamed protein product, partial [Anisakis simplex]|uniref:Thioredoxin domain-containing protein n=1 Tax=Anisakis simplex TaxID=6269 RepID=A0A0M3J6B4_ANISI